ncbi:hypothetical protein C8J56DRAFT_1054836 [Mycena floridula]|nr:hypothetical protein C8J56DRAFT_1054836 [Mycena floridula]
MGNIRSVKTDPPEKYSGNGSANEFDSWLPKFLRYLSLLGLTGLDCNAVQIKMLGANLTGTALEWFEAVIDPIVPIGGHIRNWHMDDAIWALYKHFIQDVTINNATHDFDEAKFNSATGIHGLYFKLLKLGSRMITPPDNQKIIFKILRSIPPDMRHYVIQKKEAVPELLDRREFVKDCATVASSDEEWQSPASRSQRINTALYADHVLDAEDPWGLSDPEPEWVQQVLAYGSKDPYTVSESESYSKNGSDADVESDDEAHPLENPVNVALGTVGSRSKINFGTYCNVKYGPIDSKEYWDVLNIDRYDAIVGTMFMRQHGIALDFEHDVIRVKGKACPTMKLSEDVEEHAHRSHAVISGEQKPAEVLQMKMDKTVGSPVDI